MSTGLNTQQREALKGLEAAFPGNQIKGEPGKGSGLTADIASVRKGRAPVSDLPWMLPENQERFTRTQQVYFDNRYDRTNPEDMREYASLIKKTTYPYPKEVRDTAKAELASYQEFELTNWVMASVFAGAAFQVVNLAADELPLITRPRSRNMQRFTVRSIGQDGGARMTQWQTVKSAESLDMEMLSTDRVQYPLIDIQQGDVNQLDAINVELSYDMDMKIDNLALAQIIAAKTVSGLRDLLNLHPDIDVLNLPDTNYLDLSGLGNAGVLTLIKMKAILSHLAQFGAAGDPEHAISIRTIMLSPQNLRDSWDFTDLVYPAFDGVGAVAPPTTVPHATRESIFQTGMFTSAWGYSWNWTPNARISKGRMYVFTNQPLGWLFTKTNLDGPISWQDDPDHIEQNYGEILYRRALAYAVPDLWKYRVLIIDL